MLELIFWPVEPTSSRLSTYIFVTTIRSSVLHSELHGRLNASLVEFPKSSSWSATYSGDTAVAVRCRSDVVRRFSLGHPRRQETNNLIYLAASPH